MTAAFMAFFPSVIMRARSFWPGGPRGKPRVGEVCSSPAVTIEPGATAEQGLAKMTERGFRHLPVDEDERLNGIVSIGELVNDVLHAQQQLIDQLERYVAGRLVPLAATHVAAAR